MYNLEEIKVRWKKAALENCTGVPCVVAPPVPASACGSTSTVLDFDGNSYVTVAIGTQCWTKTNLKVTRYNDGTLIGDSTNSTWGTAGAALIGARTEYTGPYIPSSGYVGTYGYLYNWYAATDPRKLCPTGWHVPTDAEWTTMIQQLDNTASTSTDIESTTAGGKMKSTSSLFISPNIGADNSSGFSALPGGWRTTFSFHAIKNNAFFWSATESSNTYTAWNRELQRINATVERKHNNGPKSTGASVRCLKD